MNKCCNCGRIFESTKTCWDCKHFIRPSGPEYWGYGDCKLYSRSVNSEDTCVDFKDKEDISDEITPKVEMKDTQKTPVKIEIIKRKSAIDETKYVFMVHVYDNKGELIDVTGFKTENLAGRYAFEIEQYYKFLKED